MVGILADNDAEGQLAILLRYFQAEPWTESWSSMNLVIHTFESLGLARTAPDSTVWMLCQHEQVVLITGNRNRDGEHSLEATIQASNSPDCLPVITLADRERVRKDRKYARRTADRIMDYLIEIDNLRGTGRLYVP